MISFQRQLAQTVLPNGYETYRRPLGGAVAESTIVIMLGEHTMEQQHWFQMPGVKASAVKCITFEWREGCWNRYAKRPRLGLPPMIIEDGTVSRPRSSSSSS